MIHFLDQITELLLTIGATVEVLDRSLLHLRDLLDLDRSLVLLLEPVFQVLVLILKIHDALDVVAILQSCAHLLDSLRRLVALPRQLFQLFLLFDN